MGDGAHPLASGLQVRKLIINLLYLKVFLNAFFPFSSNVVGVAFKKETIVSQQWDTADDRVSRLFVYHLRKR